MAPHISNGHSHHDTVVYSPARQSETTTDHQQEVVPESRHFIFGKKRKKSLMETEKEESCCLKCLKLLFVFGIIFIVLTVIW